MIAATPDPTERSSLPAESIPRPCGDLASSDTYDVIVVGYGPSGLVLASALGRRGHRVLAVERWASLYGLPRLTHIDGEVARIIQNVGDVDRALQGSEPASEYIWRNGEGETLLTVDWSGESSGYAAHYTMYQPDIEDAIDADIRDQDTVDVLQGWQAVHLSQDSDEVTLRIRPWSKDRQGQTGQPGDRSDGTHPDDRTVTARYIVGADGANSFVRTSLGIERDDLESNDVWLNLDTEKLRELPERFAVSTQFCDPVRPNMFMPIGARRHRFEVAVLPGESLEEAATEEYAWRWFRERHGLGPDDVRILRQIVYVFSARTAQRWREGRAFLIGDAAHTMPPYMGQGACSGMRDGLTLAWKLDLVLRGFADDAFLDTYEAERRPHVAVIQATSVALGEIANLRDVEAAKARDEAFRTGTAPPPPPFPTIDAGYLAPGEQPFAGTLSPQGVITKDWRTGLFDDIIGNRINLVTSGDPASVLSRSQFDRLAEVGVDIVSTRPGNPWSVTDDNGTYRDYFAAIGAEAYVARPDFVVFGTGSMAEVPGLVDELLGQLRGARAWREQALGAQTPRVPTPRAQNSETAGAEATVVSA
ncbi:bifunctional 3-(3-hydroxy-phenyl)propionate/3-hydroxycinnamic acid hydroxylase [Brevibacterium casei]|uniref:bifunctional 3-(3-hydroxy-phenyl)propionate/3-hydroxycinnamic acid hydroxylase MhpA n=1 Tax=Brevibacterium casei TaxID=33889 RepID=UPI0019199247|nr:bifunctional 3-(3-hydroxy-phenyl)propionate/3-hydroxycinnamic acid hydroxylase [Brevibacterium casei]QQT69631.1 bifunctional 3-(3-hydroxy-phenyl)propionate/3-hydroxycinnamic acid hydroxylase [Brevibacterium casei]